MRVDSEGEGLGATFAVSLPLMLARSAVSDIEMPDEDGYSLIAKVRALGKERGGKVPAAAALTAYAGEEDRIRVLQSGFQIHVPKPISPSELVAVVANLAGRTR